MSSGIYKILNKIDGKFYIGSAINIRKRQYVHLCRLRKGTHDNKHLQAAYDKNGENAFEFWIIELCSKDELIINEQKWLDETKCFNREVGYNACSIAGNSIGYKHTEEFRKWQSNRMLGSKRSIETRLKMSKSHKGKIKTKEHCDNIAKSKRKQPALIVGKMLIKNGDGTWHR